MINITLEVNFCHKAFSFCHCLRFRDCCLTFSYIGYHIINIFPEIFLLDVMLLFYNLRVAIVCMLLCEIGDLFVMYLHLCYMLSPYTHYYNSRLFADGMIQGIMNNSTNGILWLYRFLPL